MGDLAGEQALVGLLLSVRIEGHLSGLLHATGHLQLGIGGYAEMLPKQGYLSQTAGGGKVGG